MSLTVFFAVLLAAALHAVWNAVVKSSADKTLSMSAVVIGHAPFAVVALMFVPMPELSSWPWIVTGIVLHMGYQLFLINSYKLGDLTHVYPLARGSAPLIVALVSVLVLGVTLLPIEQLAIAVIGLGILSLALVRGQDGLRNSKATRSALITGCFIAGYTLVDGLGAREAGTAVGFIAVLMIGNSISMALFTAWYTPDVLRRLPTQGLKILFIGGGASFVAFTLVVWSFTQAPIALVAALRETSIIFALLIGVFALKEKLNLIKVFATMTTLAGIALLRFAR